MKILLCRLSWVLACCCLACQGVGNEHSLAITLPSLPPGWQNGLGVDSYRLRYLDGQGRLCEASAPWGASILNITPGKGAVVPILAEPCTGAPDSTPPEARSTSFGPRAVRPAPGLRLRPAGAVAPFDTSETGTTTLTWRRGFACGILLDLAQNGIAIDGYNCERLIREIDEKATGDPFDLDRTEIVASIVSGAFRVTDIKPLPRRDTTLTPGRGTWFTESPFSRQYETAVDESLCLSLTLGFHHLLDLSGGIRYDIQVGEQEITILKVLP